MQYLLIKSNDTLTSISKIVGSQNIDLVLSENGLKREPNIGRQHKKKCDDLIAENPPEITGQRKASLLNSLTGSDELFEKACLMDENEWKVFSAFQFFTDALRIPETVILPFSERIIGDSIDSTLLLNPGGAVSGASSGRSADNRYGSRTAGSSGNGVSGNGVPSSTQGAVVASQSVSNPSRASSYFDNSASTGTYSGSNNQSSVTGSSPTTRTQSSGVDSVTYKAVMKQLKEGGTIDPAIFNSVNALPVIGAVTTSIVSQYNANVNPIAFNLPWGKIQVHSSLLDQVMDIPAYPEELQESRSATYTSMPDTIYQYEPWILYQNSGPREQSLSFHLHRDMWSGNHLDGKAIELIRFCQANTFPRYSGSAVLSSTFKIYINGKTFVSGVLNNVTVDWKGPLGQDDWYLEFVLTLSFQEVSEVALNIDTVNKFGLVGGN